MSVCWGHNLQLRLAMLFLLFVCVFVCVLLHMRAPWGAEAKVMKCSLLIQLEMLGIHLHAYIHTCQLSRRFSRSPCIICVSVREWMFEHQQDWVLLGPNLTDCKIHHRPMISDTLIHTLQVLNSISYPHTAHLFTFYVYTHQIMHPWHPVIIPSTWSKTQYSHSRNTNIWSTWGSLLKPDKTKQMLLFFV